MQEIKKSRIVIASVLKPVNDTRMTEKLGGSLQQRYDVHIIGFPAAHTHVIGMLTVHPLPFFKRLSFKRLLARITILSRTVRLRPDVFIITTHELLTAGLVAKALTGCRLIYDIQENYWRNILYTPAFPRILRPFIAAIVRLRERMAMKFIDHCFLAEAGYRDELRFLPDRVTVLENKIVRPRNEAQLPINRRYPEGKTLHLLFSGTLAESTGVFTAIRLTHTLHALDNSVRLTVIGYCALPEQLKQLKKECAAVDYIQLTGGDQLVPHQDILTAIQVADVGIIAYLPNPATKNSVPTKLYEYLGYHLPVLLTEHPVWQQRCALYNAAVTFNNNAPDAAEILRQLRMQTFYTTAPTGTYWDTEAEKLHAVIESVLNQRYK
jgi:hypothetical protein